jgi:hypothetical protein
MKRRRKIVFGCSVQVPADIVITDKARKPLKARIRFNVSPRDPPSLPRPNGTLHQASGPPMSALGAKGSQFACPLTDGRECGDDGSILDKHAYYWRDHSELDSASFADASHCRQLASNCAFAASRVGARPSVRMSSGLPRIPCSDQYQRR